MRDSISTQLPAVAMLPGGAASLQRRLAFGVTEGSMRLFQNNSVRSISFAHSGADSSVVPPPPGFEQFLAPESHVAPLRIFVAGFGMANHRNQSFRAIAQNTVLTTGKSTVTGHNFMVRGRAARAAPSSPPPERACVCVCCSLSSLLASLAAPALGFPAPPHANSPRPAPLSAELACSRAATRGPAANPRLDSAPPHLPLSLLHRTQSAELVLYQRLRLALIIISPLRWRNPETGETQITGARSSEKPTHQHQPSPHHASLSPTATHSLAPPPPPCVIIARNTAASSINQPHQRNAGFSTATFAWDEALKRAAPAETTLYVVVTSPRTELNVDMSSFGQVGIDTRSFTLKVERNSVQNLGWGAWCFWLWWWWLVVLWFCSHSFDLSRSACAAGDESPGAAC